MALANHLGDTGFTVNGIRTTAILTSEELAAAWTGTSTELNGDKANQRHFIPAILRVKTNLPCLTYYTSPSR